MDAAGRGQRIVQPARERLAPGVAYWVGCSRAPQSVTALEVTPPAEGVDFGSLVTERNVSIRNLHPTATVGFVLKQRDSESPPDTGGYPELSGPVPLSVLSKDANNEWAWSFFPTNGLSRTLAPGEEWVLRLGVRRQDLNPFTPQGQNGAAYQSILEITDAAESLLVRLPALVAFPQPGLATATLGGHSDKEGLWVGQVSVNQVNAPAYTTNLLSTPTPATFRLLVHVDGTNQARLLQQAIQWALSETGGWPVGRCFQRPV